MRAMLKTGVLIVACALLGMGQSAVADDGAKTGKKAKKTRVCKRVRVTGTHFAKRICRTQAQWEEMRAEDERERDRIMTANPRDIPFDGGAPPI